MTQGTGETPTENSGGSAVGGMPTPDAVVTEASASGSPAPTTPVVDWSKVDLTAIPEDVIKSSPLYKQVLSESIERRRENADLKQKIQQTEVKLPEGDQPEWAKNLVNTVNEQNKILVALTAQTAKSERESIATKHGIPAEMVGLIAGENIADFEANAAVIGAALKKSGGVISGNASAGNAASGGDQLSGVRNRLKQGMNEKGELAPSIFNPGTQTTRGGGAMVK